MRAEPMHAEDALIDHAHHRAKPSLPPSQRNANPALGRSRCLPGSDNNMGPLVALLRRGRSLTLVVEDGALASLGRQALYGVLGSEFSTGSWAWPTHQQQHHNTSGARGSPAGNRGGSDGASSQNSSSSQPPPQQHTVFVPGDVLKAQRTCAGVWGMLRGIPAGAIPMKILSQALDHTVKVSKGPGYKLTPMELEAVARLLGMATERLGNVDAWMLAAFIRCAAGFKGLLTPTGLVAWQAALQQPGMVGQLSPQGISNALLSLGTLADSNPRLAAAVDEQLMDRLLHHAVGAVGSIDGNLQQVANTLYGAALLGLQPSQPQMAVLFGVVLQYVGSMKPEELTQVLLACQRLVGRGNEMQRQRGLDAPPPAQNPYHIYYPGDELMGQLLDSTRKLGRHRMRAREASQTLGACGALGYLPDPAALEELLAVVAIDDSLTIMHASAALLGCAKLDICPAPEVIAACSEAVLRNGASNMQGLANGAWALAVLEACDLAMWGKLAALIGSGASSAEEVALFQWHQAYLLMKQRYGGGVACPPELLERSLAAHLSCGVPGKPGHFEQAVAGAVRQLAGGQGVEVGYAVHDPDGQGRLWVDVALPGLRIVIEADGPPHFLRNMTPLQHDGTTLARNRLLRGWGWHVIVVPYTAKNKLFMRVSRHEQLVAGLRRYLEQHTDLVHCTHGPAASSAT